MTAATATAAPGLETLRREVAALEGEISNLTTKLADAQKELDALDTERGRIAEAIALGQEKPSKAGEIARLIEQAEARINGFRSVLSKKQAELDKLWPELRRIEAENLLAKRRAELETKGQLGREIVDRINSKLRCLIVDDLPALDAIRDEMVAKFRDLGGQAAGAALCESLLTNNGTLIEEDRLTTLRRDLHTSPPAWTMRGDVVLTVRNLWPPKR